MNTQPKKLDLREYNLAYELIENGVVVKEVKVKRITTSDYRVYDPDTGLTTPMTGWELVQKYSPKKKENRKAHKGFRTLIGKNKEPALCQI